MSSQSRQAKVLRIGIIQDGKIVQERLIKAGESVSVGESAKNTFVFPKTHLASAEFTLFKASGNGYVLQFTEQMKGKISSGGAVVALQKLATDPSVSKKDGVLQLPLTQQDRGKVSVDAVTVLFQFVAPPPVQAVKPIQQMDFRPRLLEDDDPVFLGFLGIWSALAAVLVIWVWNTEPPVYRLEDLPDRFAKIQTPKKVEEPVDIEPEIDPNAEGEAVGKEAEASKSKGAKNDNPDVAKARAEKDAKDNVLAKSKLLATLIGTTGESSSSAANIWSDDDKGLADIDGALAEAGGVTTAASDAGPRGGHGGSDGAATVDDLNGVGGGGDGGSVEGPVVAVKATTRAGSGSVDTVEGDAGAVKSTIMKNAGQLNYCYEKRLKALPNLSGRVELSWSVSAGKVDGTPLVEVNTTGDAELVTCMQQKVKRWVFPADFAGDVSFPFIFEAK
jgi:hypothetical protein